MKHFLLFLILICNPFVGYSQSCLWAFSAGYSSYSHLITLKKDNLNNIYVVYYEDSSGNSIRTTMEKRDDATQFLWKIPFTGEAMFSDVEINSQNHPVATGYFSDSLFIGSDTLISINHYSAFILEADENGNILRHILYNPSGNDFRPVDLFIPKNDELYITADVTGIHGFCSFHKLDSSWQISKDEFNNNFDNRTYSHILADSLGNVFISGTCGSGATFDNLTASAFAYQNMLVMYDSAFQAQWVKSKEYITFDNNNSLGSDGQHLYWTFLEASQTGSDTIRLVKTDASGNVILDKPGPLSNAFFPMITFSVDSNGKSLLAANIYNKLYLYRYDELLNLNWYDSILVRTSGFPLETKINCYDSVFYVANRYWGDTLQVENFMLLNPNANTQGHDIFISKWVDPLPLSATEIFRSNNLKVFPNPASSIIQIVFENEFNGVITLTDLLGKVVQTVSVKQVNNISLNISTLHSGMYLLKTTGKNKLPELTKIFIQN